MILNRASHKQCIFAIKMVRRITIRGVSTNNSIKFAHFQWQHHRSKHHQLLYIHFHTGRNQTKPEEALSRLFVQEICERLGLSGGELNEPPGWRDEFELAVSLNKLNRWRLHQVYYNIIKIVRSVNGKKILLISGKTIHNYNCSI